VFALNEDVLCVYADLDSLIEKAGLSDQELLTVNLLMKGYTLTDIADHYGKSRQNFDILLKRAIKKIVKQNNADWESYTGGRIDDGEW
jgi:DNA-binding CsgD family transcriptional regulator